MSVPFFHAQHEILVCESTRLNIAPLFLLKHTCGLRAYVKKQELIQLSKLKIKLEYMKAMVILMWSVLNVSWTKMK